MSILRGKRSLSTAHFMATGTAEVAVVTPDYELREGHWVTVAFTENSARGMTLNGRALRVKDIYASEQSKWTIAAGNYATPDQPKIDVWRPVYHGMVSADVPYRVRYHQAGDFFEIEVRKLYKHVFIPTGAGADIPELQDVFGFISQFDRGTAMDPQFMRVDSGTNYYPNKAQISITLPSGTVAGGAVPVTSTFTKLVRVGENSLNGVEIVNETRYGTNEDASLCVAEFTASLGSDDLACLNIWKTDLGEIRGITWKYAGAFDHPNQCVIRYNRATARLKRCRIDVSGATVGVGVAQVCGVYWDAKNECFDNTVVCNPTTEQNLAAYHIMYDSNAPGNLVEGRAKYVMRLGAKLQISNLQTADPCDTLLDLAGPAELYLTGTGTDLSNVTNLLDSNGFSAAVHTASGLTLFPALNAYSTGRIVHGDPSGVSSTVAPTFLVDHPTGGAKLSFGAGGTPIAGIGHFASITGLELSGNGTTRHMKVTTGGNVEAGSDNAYSFGTASKRWSQVYAADGTVNTSDAREKTDIRTLSKAERAVARALKGELCAFRWRDAVEAKGDDARIHFGIIAQKVNEAFQAEGLDPAQYGVFCRDEWVDDDGVTRDRMGIRYGELLAFILATL